jgi:hypothetical protein
MQIFGNRNTFAICYTPVSKSRNSEGAVLIYCHLMLKGNLIGDPNEWNILGNCFCDLLDLRNKVQKNQGQFRDSIFDGLNDYEIMELIYKSNQLEEEYNPAFSHLPVLKSNELWYNHTFMLAESIDQYKLVVFEEEGKLKFVWHKREDRNIQLENLNTVYVEYDLFYSVIDKFLQFLKDSYNL